MPAIDADGARLHVKTEGPAGAPAIVLSNSLGTNLHMWDLQVGKLAENFRVIRYDQRGHGKSETAPGPYSIERLSRDVIAILDGLKIERAHFCGCSMGGMSGMWLGRFAPERLDRLVLANTTPRSGTNESWNTRIRTVMTRGIEGFADMALNIWFSKGFRQRDPGTVARMREMMVSTDPQGYANCCGAIRDMDQRWGVGEIRTPTLVIGGRHDPGATPEQAQFLADHIPGAKLEMLDAAHISNVEQPAAYNAALVKFLKD